MESRGSNTKAPSSVPQSTPASTSFLATFYREDEAKCGKAVHTHSNLWGTTYDITYRGQTYYDTSTWV